MDRGTETVGEDGKGSEVIGHDEYMLVEPYDVIVAAHHGTVRLRLEFRGGQTSLPQDTFYGCEMTPAEARAMAGHMIREAELAEKDRA